MTKKGLEKSLVALMFVMVLVVFSFAERDSKKLDRLYPTVSILKKDKPFSVASKAPSKPMASNEATRLF